MMSQAEFSLPPTKNNEQPQSYGYLTITPLSLVFFKNTSSTHVLKIHFWGASQPSYLELQQAQRFPIVASLLKFKLYLLDAKASQIEVVDGRNNATIGFAALKWPLYMRSVDDKQLYQTPSQNSLGEVQRKMVYYLPFIDLEVEQTLAIHKFGSESRSRANQKIGQLKIRWESKIFDLQTKENSLTPSRLASQVRFQSSRMDQYNIRVSEVGKRNNTNPISICNIDMVEESLNQESQRGTTSFNPTFNTICPPRPKESIYSSQIGRRESNQSRIQEYIPTNPRLVQPSHNKISIYSNNSQKGRAKNGGNLDLELLRIRMDMEEYTSSGEQNKQKMIKVIFLQLLNKLNYFKELGHIDITCEYQGEKSKFRVFPSEVNKNKIYINSCLGVKMGTEVSFSAYFKKGKEGILKGKYKVGSSDKFCQVNLFNHEGILCADVKLEVFGSQERKIEEKIQQLPKTVQIQKQKPIVERMKVHQSPERDVPILLPPKSPKEKPVEPISDSYYLVIFKEQIDCQPQFYKFSDKKIDGIEPHQKYLVIPQKDLIRKPLYVQIFNKQDLLVHTQNIERQSIKGSINKQNKTCSLLTIKYFPLFKTSLYIYLGSVQQIVFLIQQITQNQLGVTRTMNIPEPKRSIEERQFQIDYQFNKRKLRTEEAGRLQTQERRMTQERVSGQSMTGHEMELAHEQGEDHNEQDNIFLVDLLTRFLFSIVNFTLPEEDQIQKEKFLQLVQSTSQDMPPEVMEAISSVFQDEMNAPINLLLLKQSLKAFNTFLNLYGQQKSNIIQEIIEQEPKAIEKIRTNSELGMINQQILWTKVFPKLSKGKLKEKVNKIYRISTYGPAQALLLIQDIEDPSMSKLRSLDICNLGVLIKEWVQQFLMQIDEKMQREKQKITELNDENGWLNIKAVNFVLQTEIGLKLSLWESLMLVQEIKGSYLCDMDAGEGLISGETFQAWLQNSISKHKANASQQSSKRSDSQFQFQNESKMKNESKNKNPSGVGKKSDILTEYKNNDSQIVDIANLLRQREEEEEKRRTELDIQRPPIKVESDLFEKEAVKRLISPKNIQEPRLEERREKENIQRNFKRNICFFSLQIVEFKNYESLNQNTIKMTVSLDKQSQRDQNPNFLYITSSLDYSEADGKIFEIKHSSTKNQTIYIKLSVENNTIGYAALDWEDYSDWWHNASQEQVYKKTLVMYSGKGMILGKISIVLAKTKSQKQNQMQQTVYSQSLKLKILESVPIQKYSYILKVDDVEEQLKINVDSSYQLKLTRPVYTYTLSIFNQIKDASCTIALEELYLKKYIVAEYPLINTLTGVFQNNLRIQMAIAGQPLGQYLHQQSTPQQVPQKKEEDFVRYSPKKKTVESRPLPSRLTKNEHILNQIDSIYQSLKQKYQIEVNP